MLALVQPQQQKPSSDGPNLHLLRPIYDRVQACMTKSSSNEEEDATNSMLVILDDITILEWIGFPLIDIIRFSRALRALCQKVRICKKSIVINLTRRVLAYSSTRLYSFGII